jgi:hypothetical protein
MGNQTAPLRVLERLKRDGFARVRWHAERRPDVEFGELKRPIEAIERSGYLAA